MKSGDRPSDRPMKFLSQTAPISVLRHHRARSEFVGNAGERSIGLYMNGRHHVVAGPRKEGRVVTTEVSVANFHLAEPIAGNHGFDATANSPSRPKGREGLRLCYPRNL